MVGLDARRDPDVTPAKSLSKLPPGGLPPNATMGVPRLAVVALAVAESVLVSGRLPSSMASQSHRSPSRRLQPRRSNSSSSGSHSAATTSATATSAAPPPSRRWCQHRLAGQRQPPKPRGEEVHHPPPAPCVVEDASRACMFLDRNAVRRLVLLGSAVRTRQNAALMHLSKSARRRPCCVAALLAARTGCRCAQGACHLPVDHSTHATRERQGARPHTRPRSALSASPPTAAAARGGGQRALRWSARKTATSPCTPTCATAEPISAPFCASTRATSTRCGRRSEPSSRSRRARTWKCSCITAGWRCVVTTRRS